MKGLLETKNYQKVGEGGVEEAYFASHIVEESNYAYDISKERKGFRASWELPGTGSKPARRGLEPAGRVLELAGRASSQLGGPQS